MWNLDRWHRSCLPQPPAIGSQASGLKKGAQTFDAPLFRCVDSRRCFIEVLEDGFHFRLVERLVVGARQTFIERV